MEGIFWYENVRKFRVSCKFVLFCRKFRKMLFHSSLKTSGNWKRAFCRMGSERTNTAGDADSCLVCLISQFVVICSLDCQNYQSLNSADRNVNYYTHYLCDDQLGPGWFRFRGAAGTRMPTSCPPTHRCNAHVPGWLNGGHPSVADGTVTRQVCFHWNSDCCYKTTNIQLRNCGSFYVYFFNGTPWCYLRYCGTNWMFKTLS